VAVRDPAIQLTPEQRGRLEERLNARLVERLRRVLPVAVLICVGFAGLCWKLLPELTLWQRIGPPLFIAADVSILIALTWVRPLHRHYGFVMVVIGTLLASATAVQSALTGGFHSPFVSTLFMVWVAGAIATPMRPVELTIGTILHLSIFIAIVWAYGDHSVNVYIFAAIGGAIALFSVLGGYLRDRAETELFLANDRLDALNASLEQRVREKVQERSRELAETLRRISAGSSDSHDLRPGDLIGGRVTILKLLGRGGMGAVYLGQDVPSAAPVAIKIMDPRIAHDATALQRFLAEATAASAVPHPGIVKTLQVDVTADGRLFQVMEYIDGLTLARRLERGPILPPHVARLGAEIADALAAAHRKRVIHRDIKPANLILCASAPGVRILDFGLSKIIEQDRAATGLTRTQQFLGTPAYMSPEQVQDASRVDSATDVYSLGISLYELASAKMPFGDVSGGALFTAHLSQEPRPLDDAAPLVPKALAELVHACLRKQATQRPSAEELSRRLAQLADQLGAPGAVAIAAGEIRGQSSASTIDQPRP
jgi:serine/threonine-protein kinase